MIKFFRKIRYELMEKNKTGKYLKYAIGEIILVVIGILIALQINNWNENKKSNKELEQYINSIKTNISEDIIILDSLITRRKEIISYAKNERLTILNDTYDFETTTLGYRTLIGFYFEANTSGYEALKNSTYLGKINSLKLNSLLVDYYAEVKTIIYEERTINDYIEELETKIDINNDRTLIFSYFFMDRQELMKTNANQEKIEKTFKTVHENPAFRNIVTMAINSENTIVPRYSKLIQIGNEIMKEIESVSD
jgi:hypothetical protein